EEDATVWARYSSAYFEQGASRQACNNPYDRGVDDEQVKGMRASNIWEIKHKDFMKLIQPSFACIDEAEDMDAIIARTHIIFITDHGIYWRLAHPQHRTVPFVQWPENEPHDLLIPSQKDIFRSYKKDPFKHTPPPSFHADMVWSQEVLQRLFRGESIRRTITIRPGAGDDMDIAEESDVHSCPCQTRVIPGCNGSLIEKTDKQLEAICYTLSGPVEVIHQSKQCTARNCRATYGYNFRWVEGKKVNVHSIKDFADGMLFVNAKKGFSLQYLQYHEELVCRGHLSTRAIEHAYNEVFGDEDDQVVTDFRKLHQTAMFYHLALQEFEVLGLHMTLVHDDEVTDKALDIYSAYCHATLFPPSSRSKVNCLVGDGHLALGARCEDGPCKRARRPRKNTQPIGKHSNGWFMCCDPTSCRIVSLMVMHEPECNEY
ncbi:unnamed protein product, partial [Symbiodinium microadriaticum]